MKKLILYQIFYLLIISITAQNANDALRMSQTSWNGTARFMGTCSSMGAIGGDFSVLSVNPASIGMYKRMDISTSLGLNFYNGESLTDNYAISTTEFKFAYTNLGIVFPIQLKNSNWKFVQFGIGFNRINDFNEYYNANRDSKNSTLMDVYLDNANGIDYSNLSVQDPFNANLAWNLWLIDTIVGTTNQYYSVFSNKDLQQSNNVSRRGRTNEMVFSIGSNYNDKFYIGATVGIPFLNLTSYSTYEEIDNQDTVKGFYSYSVLDQLKTQGTGVNLKLGINYQPLNFLRVGIAFHTPTLYYINDKFSRSIQTTLDNHSSEYKDSPDQSFNYQLVTPYKLLANVGFILFKRGFINLEYEFTDQSAMKMSASNYNFSVENADIKSMYKTVHTIRIGGEIGITSNFFLRCGYAYSSNPYKNKLNNGNKHIVGCGLGFKGDYFYADIAYNYQFKSEKTWMYDASYYDVFSKITYHKHLINLSIGCKF